MTSLQVHSFFKVGEIFIIVDAGGGTVVSYELELELIITDRNQDLIAYKVVKLNPLQLDECGITEGKTLAKQ